MKSKTLLCATALSLLLGIPALQAVYEDDYPSLQESVQKMDIQSRKDQRKKRRRGTLAYQQGVAKSTEEAKVKSEQEPESKQEDTNSEKEKQNSNKTKKPVVQKQDSLVYKALSTLWHGNRVEKALAILAEQEISPDWTDQSKNTIGWGITDLIKAISDEDGKHDLNALRGIQDTLDENQPRLEKLQEIISLISDPKVHTQEGENLALLRMDEDKLANADTALLANMEQQLKLYQLVTTLICARLSSLHETRKVIRKLKLAKEELAKLPDHDYNDAATTFNEMCKLAEQE